MKPPGQRVLVGGTGLVLLALLVSLAFATIPRRPYILDDQLSEKAVLNYADQKGWQFGRDLVFTYGPLGFLTSRYFFPYAATLRLAVDFLFCFAVAYGVCRTARRLGFLWGSFLMAVFVFVAANLDPRSDLLLYIGLFSWALLCLVESGVTLWMCGLFFGVLAIFGAMVKANFLIAGGATAGWLVLESLLRRKWVFAVTLVLGLPAGFVMGWSAAGQHVSNLEAFFLNAWSIAASYDQNVGLEGLSTLTRQGLLVLSLAVATSLIRGLFAFPAHEQHVRLRRLLFLGWLLALLFLIWKHGYVRADLYHTAAALGFIPVFVLLLDVVPSGGTLSRVLARVLGVTVCVIGCVAVQTLFLADLKASLLQPVRAFALNLRTFTNPSGYSKTMLEALSAARQQAALPELRKVVGDSTADVFGQDQLYALFNDLNYHPRPVFQSYMAYNAALMRLNEEFYLSKAAPDYVLFELSVVDRKFPPLEDAWVLRDLLMNYEPGITEGHFLLLPHKSSFPAKISLLREGTIRLGEPLGLPAEADRALWLEIQARPTWRGRLRRVFFKPPKMRVAVWSDVSMTHRLARSPASLPTLAAGFLASPLMLKNEDVLNFYNGTVTRPGAYSVECEPEDKALWEDQVEFRLFKIENLLNPGK